MSRAGLPGACAGLADEEARALYSEPSVREYIRERVQVELLDTGEAVGAYCYKLPPELGLAGTNPAYATKLSRLVEETGISIPAETRGCASPTGTFLESGHASVNGIRMYYEVHGQRGGVPLVLLHGGGSTIESTFGRVLPCLARHRHVIALEEQGHGRTSDRDGPFSFEASADDVAPLLRELDIEQADLFGWSNGASVALQVAIRHPGQVRKLVFASSMTRRDGARPALWEFMENADFSSMPALLKEAFLKVNPDVEQLRAMHDKDAARMASFADVLDDRVRSIRAATLILIGDRDVVKPEHAVELSRRIPVARLLRFVLARFLRTCILPGGHADYLGEVTAAEPAAHDPEITARLVEQFLAAPADAR